MTSFLGMKEGMVDTDLKTLAEEAFARYRDVVDVPLNRSERRAVQRALRGRRLSQRDLAAAAAIRQDERGVAIRAALIEAGFPSGE